MNRERIETAYNLYQKMDESKEIISFIEQKTIESIYLSQSEKSEDDLELDGEDLTEILKIIKEYYVNEKLAIKRQIEDIIL